MSSCKMRNAETDTAEAAEGNSNKRCNWTNTTYEFDFWGGTPAARSQRVEGR